jgi:hypothetical protein
MSWLEKIQNGPKQKKIRAIWTITGIACLLLIALWIIIGNYGKSRPKDFRLFQTLGQGIKDVSKQNFKQPIVLPGQNPPQSGNPNQPIQNSQSQTQNK